MKNARCSSFFLVLVPPIQTKSWDKNKTIRQHKHKVPGLRHLFKKQKRKTGGIPHFKVTSKSRYQPPPQLRFTPLPSSKGKTLYKGSTTQLKQYTLNENLSNAFLKGRKQLNFFLFTTLSCRVRTLTVKVFSSVTYLEFLTLFF